MDGQESILLVDDDEEILELLSSFLCKNGFHVSIESSGTAMIQRLEREDFSLLVLDIMMPELSGLDAYRRLRRTKNIPVIFLSALGDSDDKIKGLNLGSDDYLAKPFNPGELLARIKAVLRRYDQRAPQSSDPESSQLLHFSGWTVNPVARHLVSPAGVVVNLSGAEYRLLWIFLKHPMEVLGRDTLIAAMLGREVTPFDRSLDVQICRLRARLGDNGREAKIIKTVRGDGYVFTAKVEYNKD